jgi:riboflavin synthase
MFTGLVRSRASVVKITPRAGGARIAVDLGPLAEGAAPGDSISINGACLTVAAKNGTVCEFDAVAETLSRTTLGRLRPGDPVNVEPSLRVGDALGGHFVLGHVDGTGTLAALTPGGEGALLRISVDSALTAAMVPKGSVAVDGVSLTLVEVGADYFTCAIIPATLRETTLSAKRPGDAVNVETDILGKMVAKYLGKMSGSSGLTLDKLREAGFT